VFRISEVPHGATRDCCIAFVWARMRAKASRRIWAIASAIFPSGEKVQSPQARATVFVSAGVFRRARFWWAESLSTLTATDNLTRMIGRCPACVCT